MYALRKYLNILREAETMDLPGWFTSGMPVADMDARSPDAGSILEAEEFDYEWRDCRVPVAALRHAILQPDDRQPDERVADIEAWFAEHGVEEALLSAPPLALILPDTGEIKLLDGYHRLSLAVIEHGLLTVPLLVAVGADMNDAD